MRKVGATHTPSRRKRHLIRDGDGAGESVGGRGGSGGPCQRSAEGKDHRCGDAEQMQPCAEGIAVSGGVRIHVFLCPLSMRRHGGCLCNPGMASWDR